MNGDGTEDHVRAAAIDWLTRTTHDGTVPVSRAQLANDFFFDGRRFALVDRGRGIRKPQGWSSALSILTAAPKDARWRPYDDSEGPDGLHRYKLRRDVGGEGENEALRVAMIRQVPLIWFYGIQPGVFQAIFPVWLIAEEPEQSQFVMALTQDQRLMRPDSPIEEALRRWNFAQTKRRLHQAVFASQVKTAYDIRCAVCALNQPELIDAAHIIPDSHPNGAAIVTNGLALCKLHHAAYDGNILGIRPDYRVEISGRLLDQNDGPMLRHGLQEHHERALMHIPGRRADWPDVDRLMERYLAFKAA